MANEWKRDKAQEGGNVLLWYEKNNGSIASLVETGNPNEAEWRVSQTNMDSFSWRGDKRLMERGPDLKHINKINSMIRREKMK